MYFSLITPAQGRLRDAANQRSRGPYEEHRWLWRFFPGEPDAKRDFLFRRREVAGTARYYLVSARQPHEQDDAWSVQTRKYAPELDAGTRLRFDLRVNPVVAVKRDGKSRRDDVVMAEKKRLLQERGLTHWQQWSGDDKPALYDVVDRTCAAWLQARAERLGFSVDREYLTVDAYQTHVEKRELPDKQRLRFSTVEFSGLLTVGDAKKFQHTLFHGIGPAKAFGCGLLLVRRL